MKNLQVRNENYSIQAPDTRFIIEIAGPGNRWQNIVKHFDRMSDSDKYNYAITLENDVDANKFIIYKDNKKLLP